MIGLLLYLVCGLSNYAWRDVESPYIAFNRFIRYTKVFLPDCLTRTTMCIAYNSMYLANIRLFPTEQQPSVRGRLIFFSVSVIFIFLFIYCPYISQYETDRTWAHGNG